MLNVSMPDHLLRFTFKSVQVSLVYLCLINQLTLGATFCHGFYIVNYVLLLSYRFYVFAFCILSFFLNSLSQSAVQSDIEFCKVCTLFYIQYNVCNVEYHIHLPV